MKTLGDCIEGIFLGYEELMDIIDKHGIPKERWVATRGEDNKYFYLDPEKKYILRTGFENSHEWGVGGKTVQYTFLERDGSHLLRSISTNFYETYSDDSTDFETGKQRATYLDNEDELAIAVFKEIQSLMKKGELK